MKALILANIGSGHYNDGQIVPSCFLPLYNNMTIIDRQISLLNVNGIPNEDICVLLGSNGIWKTVTVKGKTDCLATKVILTQHGNALAEGIFDNPFFDDDLIILEGNRVLDIAIISRLKRFRHKDVLVVSDILDPDNAKQLISVEDDRVKAIVNSDIIRFPWVAFAGVMKLSTETVKKLASKTECARPLLDAVEDILPECNLMAIKYEDLVYGTIDGKFSSELTGGSYSRLNYRMVVKKESDNEGRDKLINEIKWLLSVPPDLKPYFSEVLEYDIKSPKVFYNVPYYGSRNLREHIFDGHLDAKAACDFLEGLLDWMFKNVYSRKMGETPNDWVMKKHVRRVLDRLPECKEKCPELGRIIDADKVVVNGVEYRNVRRLYEEIAKNEPLLKRLKPKEMDMIHGDLHFQNILLTNDTDTGFILVDPRGESRGSDIYYDLGKLWHSFHAKYDFIHSDQFKLDLRWEGDTPTADFHITNLFAEKVYNEIYEEFQKVILKYDFIRNDPDWEMKVLFAEASHLCSVAIFHIGKTKTPDRPITLYLIGVRLINEFYNRYLGDNKT